MKIKFKDQIVQLLNEHRIMIVATNRPDSWPQATVAGYVNDGLALRDPRVSVAIARDYPQPLAIRGLSWWDVH